MVGSDPPPNGTPPRIRWSDPLARTLIAGGFAIAAALIGGIFLLISSIISSEPPPALNIAIANTTPIATPVAAEFLGEGSASLTAPEELPFGGTSDITLIVSLETLVGPGFTREDIEVEQGPLIADESPDVRTGPTGEPEVTWKFPGIPLYREMRAKLVAPAFGYEKGEWEQKTIQDDKVVWSWGIVIGSNIAAGPHPITVHLDANGYTYLLRSSILIITPTLSPEPGPYMMGGGEGASASLSPLGGSLIAASALLGSTAILWPGMWLWPLRRRRRNDHT